jgi:hypothetical protein
VNSVVTPLGEVVVLTPLEEILGEHMSDMIANEINVFSDYSTEI